MSRGRLNRDAARKAFLEHYETTGEPLTWEDLRLAGGGGSNRDIQQLRSELLEEARDASRLHTALPKDVVQDFWGSLAKIHRTLEAQADARVEAGLAGMTKQLEASEAHARVLAGKLDEGEAEIERLKKAVSDLESRLEQVRVERDEYYKRAIDSEGELKVSQRLHDALKGGDAKGGAKRAQATPGKLRTTRKTRQEIEA